MPPSRSSCLPCRMRKVKCDIAAAKDGQGCSKCANRSIQCPGVSETPAVKKRKGATVDAVEALYGSPEAPQLSTTSTARDDCAALLAAQEMRKSDTFGLSQPRSEDLRPAISRTELDLARVELRGELSMTLIQECSESHDIILRLLVPELYRDRFLQSGRRFERMDTLDEVMARAFLAFGARGSLHSAIIGSGSILQDVRSLGARREPACVKLAQHLVERFDASGLWRQSTSEAIQLACIVYVIATSVSAEYSRPIVVAAVQAAKQLLDSTDTPEFLHHHFRVKTAPTLVWLDAFSSAELAVRPAFSNEDIEDYLPDLAPALLGPLNLPTASSVVDWLDLAKSALLRRCARLLHSLKRSPSRPLPPGADSHSSHQQVLNTIAEMKTLFGDLDLLETQSLALYESELGNLEALHPFAPLRSELNQKAMNAGNSLKTFLNIELLLHRALEKAVSVVGTELVEVWAEAGRRCKRALKLIARLVADAFRAWHRIDHRTTLSRLFFTLEGTPQWVRLATDDSGEDPLNSSELDWICRGLEISCEAAAFAEPRLTELKASMASAQLSKTSSDTPSLPDVPPEFGWSSGEAAGIAQVNLPFDSRDGQIFCL